MTIENAAHAAEAAAEAAAEQATEKEIKLSALEVLGWTAIAGITLGFVTQLTVNAFSSTDTTNS